MPRRRAASTSTESTPTPYRTMPRHDSPARTSSVNRGPEPASTTAEPAATARMSAGDPPSPLTILTPRGASVSSSMARSAYRVPRIATVGRPPIVTSWLDTLGANDCGRQATCWRLTVGRLSAQSFVIRCRYRPDRTVQAVLRTARRLGYQPNSVARGLKLRRTFTIGMLVPDLTNPLFPPIVRGIEDRLRDSGFIVVLANTDNDDDKERSLLAAMTARRVDGLILATARREYPLLRRVTGAGIPTVLVNRTTDAATVPAVLSDDHSGIGQAVRHLAGLGHTRIAHVGGTREVSTGVARYQSFVSWMREVGLDPDPERIVFARWFREDLGAEAFR